MAEIKLNQIILADCMDIMRDIPDKYFELAIVDPPYGADFIGPCGRLDRYGGLDSCNINPPDNQYFSELFRVSSLVVIWGGNYFALPPCKCFIIWDKKQPQTATYAQAEYAWTNLPGTSKIFYKRVIGADDIRIHPTQKPVDLYRWLLQKYAKPGDKIIDTHSGSGSCAIACHIEKHDFLAIEKDPDYHAASVKRLEEVRAQGVLF